MCVCFALQVLQESFYPKSSTGRAVRKEIRNLFDVLGNVRAQNQHLDPVQINEDREMAKKETDDLRKQLSNLSQQLTNAHNDLTKAKKKLSNCQQFKANVEAKPTKFEKLNGNLQEKLNQVNQEKHDLQILYQQDQQHFRGVQRELEAKVVQLDRQLQALTGQDELVDVVQLDQPLDLTLSLPSQHHVTEEMEHDFAQQFDFLPTQDVAIVSGDIGSLEVKPDVPEHIRLADGRIFEMDQAGSVDV